MAARPPLVPPTRGGPQYGGGSGVIARPTGSGGPIVPPRQGGGGGSTGGPRPGDGRRVVGYGLNGGKFYDINAYRRSAGFRQAGGRISFSGPVREQPLSQGNRLAGVRPSFPHTGAPAAPGTADQHVDTLRQRMMSGDF